jgi:hypothetical protein
MRFCGEIHVADGDALPPAHAEAHRGQRYIAGLHVVDAEAADEIQAAFDTGKRLNNASVFGRL